MMRRHLLTYLVLGLISLSFPAVLAASSPGPDIHLILTSQKVPIQRNQLKIIFSAVADSGAYQGTFSPYLLEAQVISQDYPSSFWFSQDPFSGSFIASFLSDGLFIVYGNLEDYSLKGITPPAGFEIDPLLAISALYVKVVEGNAIEITQRQYQHEYDKAIQDMDHAKAGSRVRQEVDFALDHISDFAVESGDYSKRFVEVQNNLGLSLLADNGDLHQQLLEKEVIGRCRLNPKCHIIRYCENYTIDPVLNEAIDISGKIQYESLYPTGDAPVGAHWVYLSVRSWVWLSASICPPGVDGGTIYTIKSILYPFYTDGLGNITGTIYAAPPYDAGLPYVEYLDTHSNRVNAVTQDFTQTHIYNYEMLSFSYGTKNPNSLILTNGEYGSGLFATFFQYENPKRLDVQATYREAYEPRTFFLPWDARLDNIHDR